MWKSSIYIPYLSLLHAKRKQNDMSKNVLSIIKIIHSILLLLAVTNTKNSFCSIKAWAWKIKKANWTRMNKCC